MYAQHDLEYTVYFKSGSPSIFKINRPKFELLKINKIIIIKEMHIYEEEAFVPLAKVEG